MFGEQHNYIHEKRLTVLLFVPERVSLSPAWNNGFKAIRTALRTCACVTSFLPAAESRFLEPPGEKQISSRNREFEKSKVASNYAELAGYCLIMSKRKTKMEHNIT